jgi:hypothetical protein
VGRSIAIVVAAATLLCSCGADFIEPNPPRLARKHIDYGASSVAEPAVWLVISDLYLEHDEDCAAAVAWLSGIVRSSVPSSVPETLQLDAIQVSPCTQPNSRQIDPVAIDAALRDAAARFPGRNVRPVVIYANNILLAVPAQIGGALRTIRKLSATRGALEPRFWVLASTTVLASVDVDRPIGWTYVGDPAMAQQLGRAAGGDLPFLSDVSFVSPPLPLFASGPAGVQFFKVCSLDDSVQALDFKSDGSAVAFDASNPPHYRVTLQGRQAVPHEQFQPLHAGFDAEACMGHCDRYVGDEPVRWLTLPGCFLRSAS